MSFDRLQNPPNKEVYEEPKATVVSTDGIDIIMNSNMLDWDTPYSIKRNFRF